MKLHNLALIIVGCALAATFACLEYKPKRLPATPVAKQEILSSQRFENFYGLDTFAFNNEAYFVLINEKGTALYKLSNSRLALIPAELFPDSQKLIQYKVDSKGRLALILEERNGLIAEVLDMSNRIEIKLGRLEHENLGHSLCCADILCDGDGLYIWHERQLLKFDLSKKLPLKVFDQKLNLQSSDKGNLIDHDSRVYLNIHDGNIHYFEPKSPVLHSEKAPPGTFPSVGDSRDGSGGLKWDPNWPEPNVRVEKVFDFGRPVILSAQQEVLYLDEFNHWSKITSHVDLFEHCTSYGIANGKILFVGRRKEGDGQRNFRNIIIFDTITNTYQVLTLDLG